MAVAGTLPRSASSTGGLRTAVSSSSQLASSGAEIVAVEYPVGVEQVPVKSPPKLKNDKGKLTEAHGEPPLTIKRNDNGFLDRGRMLGEGGFARVYAATDSLNGAAKAVKVISKEQLKSSKTKAKLFAEIKLHQVMDHANIIKFECCFEDSGHVYMQLELCANGSMLDVLRRRKRFTEPETRYYLTQLVGAAQYMHQASVIHRDLKLGNLMLDAEMNLKVGDFGLAALVKFPGERKKTICGTPNYIAPEILFDQNVGHSFEADIWSIGVIIYTMLVGKPPFQTKDVKAIYKKIKSLEYEFPKNIAVPDQAVDLIQAILDREPQNRPSASEILSHKFLYSGPFPRSIPSSATDLPPDFSRLSTSESSRNYLYVQRLSGALASISSGSASTPSIPEEDAATTETTQPPEPPAQVVAVSNGMNVAAQEIAIEKEVKKVLEPGSPISELLKSARKPLMVSPRALAAQRDREKNEIVRRAVSGNVALRQLNDKENVATRPKRVNRSQEKKDVPGTKQEDGETGLETAVRALRVTSGYPYTQNKAQAPVTSLKEKRKLPFSASSSVVSGKELENEGTMIHSPRGAYEACCKTLELALDNARIVQLQEPDSVTPPKVFITAWIDYTHKYGTAYQLTDGSAGVYFNDSTTMIMAPGRQHFDYIAGRKGNAYTRRNHELESFPGELDRKVYLMTYFGDYMSKTLERDVDWTFCDNDRIRNMDFLIKYYRMKNAIVFKLSNDVVQFNFFDHTKILLTESATIITFIGPDYKLKVYSLAKLLRRADRFSILTEDIATTTFSDPAKQKTVDGLIFIFDKLQYCKEVLRTLSEKQRPSPSSAAGLP